MYICDCSREFPSKRGLGVHKKWCGKAWRGCQRPLIPFELLKKDSSRKVRLLSERGHVCERCGTTEWMNETVPLELDHIDGMSDNNEKTNLRLLCPNCHSQMPTHAGSNAGRGGNTKRKETFSRYPNYRKLRAARTSGSPPPS